MGKKNAFASCCLFGKDNDSSISGVWVFKGKELAFELSEDWQIDYASYAWKKLDSKSQKLGPAVIYAQDNGIVRAFRNIPGVEVLDVNNLNVLRLAPGGHVGRFLIFTEDAFKALDTIYGNFSAGSSSKKNWSIPSAVIQNSDLQALLQSDEVQSVLNAPKASDTIKRSTKKNPLTNIRAMLKLNPNAATEKRAAWKAESAAKKAKN